MSLLSPSVRIAITPGRVAVTNGAGYRDAGVATAGWAGALEALAGLLAGSKVRGRASVTLSQHFAPVHLLPSPPVVLKTREQQAWVRDALVRQYGDASRDWRLAWQPEPPGEPYLVTRLAADRLAALETLAHTASLRLARVQPWLAAASRRRGPGRATVWFTLAEPERLTLAHLQHGRIRHLRSVRTQGDAATALADLITREALLAGETTPAPVWIESVLPGTDWKGALGERSVQGLPAGRNPLDAMLRA